MERVLGFQSSVRQNVASALPFGSVTRQNAPVVGRDFLQGQNVTVINQSERRALSPRARCRNALALTVPEDDRGSIITARGNLVHNTCEWIVRVGKFADWLRGRNSLLLISGRPVKGKTFLSIHLVKYLPQITRSMANAPLILQYYCDNGDGRRNSALAVLRGLLYRLLCADEQMYSFILPDFERHEEHNENMFSDLYKEEPWRILERMLAAIGRQVYVGV